MRIDAHAHGGHADRGADGKLRLPLRIAWEGRISPEEYIDEGRRRFGLERLLLLDPPEVTFSLKKIFGDYVIPVPRVNMDTATPEDVDDLFRQGAVGIKFIVPGKSYGSSDYFPLYDAVAANKGLAVFHTGFVLVGRFEPGCWDARRDIVEISDMRPAALDRVARAFPNLKILMAHFGNPWWEEAWKMITSHKNIYADLSGGTAFRRSMNMWKDIFAPYGTPDIGALSKLCFGTDGQSFTPGRYGTSEVYDFYDRLFDVLNVPGEIQEKINRLNILNLLER